MHIAIAQINPTIGDFPANQKKILDYAWKAKNEDQADLILFPELSLCGCPPLDLLEQDLFTAQNTGTLRKLQEFLPEDLAVGLGYVKRSPDSDTKLLNVYGIILDHEIVYEQVKTVILRKDFFDETRYFETGKNFSKKPCQNIFEYQGKRIGIALGDDVSINTETPDQTGYMADLTDQGISLLCIPAAIPFIAGTCGVRQKNAGEICSKWNIPVICINTVGANDSIIFDGRSFVMASGEAGSVSFAKAFEEDMFLWNWSDNEKISVKKSYIQNDPDDIENALVLGIRDYMKKCGFKRAHLGLSGGIDSALVACLAVKAAGPENVVCFNMPSRYSSRGSMDDSRELANNLGSRYEVLPIEPVYSAALSVLEKVFEKKPFDAAEENLQARIRGILWMAYANKNNSMLLAGGNKSELAMGYCTIYGDTNGALAPIGDLFKTEVYDLCRRINERSMISEGKKLIPQAIIDKPPSAELRPGQKDQDSLPPYDILDEILKLILYKNMSPGEIANMGWDRDLVNRIYRSIVLSEWKRRQTAPVLKVSVRAFGVGRNLPLARAVFEI